MKVGNEKRHPLMSGKRNEVSKIENVTTESLKLDELLDSLLALHYLINILDVYSNVNAYYFFQSTLDALISGHISFQDFCPLIRAVEKFHARYLYSSHPFYLN